MFQKFFSKNFYIVGGCVRDFVINRKITDIDLLGICSEEEFRLVLKKLSYEYNVFPLDEKRNVWRISIGKLTIDLSRNDDIKNDIFRRDFTINSLAARVDESNIKIYKDFFEIDLDKGKIIDITGKGLSDLKDGFIRHINSSIFDEDPLRIMRAIRFLSQFNFKILPETKKLIVSKKDL
ncbi:MAG: hypothetical protein N2446_02815, partial [Elusimicrobiales bacterium]|nr:hypothetical protein [Elusimicrobiales bacterium]